MMMIELRACKTVTRVSVPFTEGHYYGMGERPNTGLADNSPLTGRQQDKRKRQQMNCKVNNKDDNSTFRYLCRSKELPLGRSRQFP